MSGVKTEYQSCISSLEILKTTIEKRDSYFFPQWAIDNALAQVKTDFNKLKNTSIENSSLYDLSKRCSQIKSMVKISENTPAPSTPWSVFSRLFFPRIIVRPGLVAPMTEASKAIFNNSNALKKYNEELKDKDKEEMQKAYGDHLYQSLFFLSKEFPEKNLVSILKLASPSISPNMEQSIIEGILRDIGNIKPIYKSVESDIENIKVSWRKPDIQEVPKNSDSVSTLKPLNAVKNSPAIEIDSKDQEVLKKAYGDHLDYSIGFVSIKYPREKGADILKSAAPFVQPDMNLEEIEIILKTVRDLPFEFLITNNTLILQMPSIGSYICNSAIPLIKPKMTADQVKSILLAVQKISLEVYKENRDPKKFLKNKNPEETCKAAALLINLNMKTDATINILKEVMAISSQEDRKEICDRVFDYMQDNPDYKEKNISKKIREERLLKEESKTDSETGSESSVTNDKYYKTFSLMKTDNKEVRKIIENAKQAIATDSLKMLFGNPRSQKELTSTYKKMVLLVHPDVAMRKKHLDKSDAEELFKFVHSSYIELLPKLPKSTRSPAE